MVRMLNRPFLVVSCFFFFFFDTMLLLTMLDVVMGTKIKKHGYDQGGT